MPAQAAGRPLHVRHFRKPQPYAPIWAAMQQFTRERDAGTPDQLWLLEHHPVFTLGRAGKQEHVLNPGDIPVIQTDRGGQVTWHGPGQLVGYVLLDTRRLHWGARQLVQQIEAALIACVAYFGVTAFRDPDRPGVYTHCAGQTAKLAALGLKIAQQGSYHGFSLNLDCSLEAFRLINPCGYPDQAVTRLADLVDNPPTRDLVEPVLIEHLLQATGTRHAQWEICDG